MRYIFHWACLFTAITIGFGFEPRPKYIEIFIELIEPIFNPYLFCIYIFPIAIFSCILFMQNNHSSVEKKCNHLIEIIKTYSLLAGMLCFMSYWVDMRLSPYQRTELYFLPCFIISLLLIPLVKAIVIVRKLHFAHQAKNS